MNNTPLRYPGGKSVMTPFFKNILQENNLGRVIYAEAYAGGAGTAINLLLENCVEGIKINDAAIGIFSFWFYLLKESDRFLDLFDKIDINLKEWQLQRKIFKQSAYPCFELGFATFYLSRTNRSGILNAGPIGGQDPDSQDAASYKIDCRFNKPTLRNKLEKIIALKQKIEVTNLDALRFLKALPDNTIAYLDPPYYDQGKALYLNYYKHKDHLELSRYLEFEARFKWVLSYDNIEAIRRMYVEFPLYTFHLPYNAQDRKIGSELLTHSDDIRLPTPLVIKRNKHSIIIDKIQT